MLPAEEIAFDPYYKWLGIPPTEQPANNYRLLGLANFEPDLDVIQAAADRQMSHVRTYQTGTHSAQSQAVLNELAKSRLCLLSVERKAAYDAELVGLQSPALEDLPLADDDFDEQPPDQDRVYQFPVAQVAPKRRKKPGMHPALLISAGLIAATVVVALAFSSRYVPEQAIAAKPEPEPTPPALALVSLDSAPREVALELVADELVGTDLAAEGFKLAGAELIDPIDGSTQTIEAEGKARVSLQPFQVLVGRLRRAANARQ